MNRATYPYVYTNHDTGNKYPVECASLKLKFFLPYTTQWRNYNSDGLLELKLAAEIWAIYQVKYLTLSQY